MDDIEALASLQDFGREQLRFYADSHGGSVAGELVVIDRHPESEGEPPGEPSANAGSDGASPSPRRRRGSHRGQCTSGALCACRFGRVES